MDMINVKINGISVSVPKGSTVLDAARAAGVEVPTLCFMKDKNEIGACRICVVEVNEGRGFRIVTACVYPASDGMEVLTNTEKIQKARKTTLELILSTHDKKCLSCVRSTNCELQKLCRDYGVDENAFGGFKPTYELDNSTPHLVRNNNKCILCRRCVAACNEQYVGVIGANNRGIDTSIGTPFEVGLSKVPCISCGQCTVVCPTGALTEKDDTDKIWEALADSSKYVIVQTAPSVRATLGECFGMPIGTNVEGKMVAAIKQLGNVKCFNMDITADLTIMEEANELLHRLMKGGKTPMFTSCCPGWVKFAEHYYPELLPNLSTCKSPQEMFSAVLKSYYCEKYNKDPKNLFIVSVIPCTAKKFEVTRDELGHYTDVALTTRELAKMIKEAGIDFVNIPAAEYDKPFGEASGAGAIFGATGGVMEAALRTAAYKLGGKGAPIEFKEVRGTEGIKEAEYTVGGTVVKVAVAHGLGNARKVIEQIKSGEKDYTFVEVMACPGGCINGGGQPYVSDDIRNNVDLKAVRAKALYDYDKKNKLRCSHDTPAVDMLYKEYFGDPLSHKSHELLHTEYVKRNKY